LRNAHPRAPSRHRKLRQPVEHATAAPEDHPRHPRPTLAGSPPAGHAGAPAPRRPARLGSKMRVQRRFGYQPRRRHDRVMTQDLSASVVASNLSEPAAGPNRRCTRILDPKSELVAAVLERRHARRVASLRAWSRMPRMILGSGCWRCRLVGGVLWRDGARGCAFLNAAARPRTPVRQHERSSVAEAVDARLPG